MLTSDSLNSEFVVLLMKNNLQENAHYKAIPTCVGVHIVFCGPVSIDI